MYEKEAKHLRKKQTQEMKINIDIINAIES